MDINVLWVNGEDLPTTKWKNNNICFITCQSVETAILLIEQGKEKYDAIILDAECKYKDADNKKSIKGMIEGRMQLAYKRISMSVFIYVKDSEYDTRILLDKILPIPENMPSRMPYYTSAEEDLEQLLDDICYAVEQQIEIIKIYRDEYEFYKKNCGDVSKLIDILKKYKSEDTDSFNRNDSIPNTIRSLAEDVCKYLNKPRIGILPIESKEGNIKLCSEFFGVDRESVIMPIPIQRCFHIIADVGNEGSHGKKKLSLPEKGLIGQIANNEFPHLNRLLINCLLSILHWCKIRVPINGADMQEKSLGIFKKWYGKKNKCNIEGLTLTIYRNEGGETSYKLVDWFRNDGE